MKYRVVRKNCLNHQLGDEIELTKEQADALVNKVELIKEEPQPVKVKRSSKKKEVPVTEDKETV